MPLNLNSRKWQEFLIGGDDGVFDISSSSSGIDKNKLIIENYREISDIPYITRTELNNGIDLFIPNIQKEKYALDNSGVITIGLDTQTVFYQPHKFFTGQNVQVLRHKGLNKLTASFLIPLLKVQMQKFNWGGNGATLGRLFKTKIMLPVNKNREIDWNFMELYSRSVNDKKKSKYLEYSKETLKKLTTKKIESLEDKNWSEFFIEDIAEIHSGRDIYDAERIAGGKTPYISAGAKKNGIGHFVENKNETLEKNCLSVNRNGSVGYSFFHKYEALFSNDCRKLKLKSNTEYAGFFIAHQITKQRTKYNYGYKMGTGRLKRQKIMLPISIDGNPDFEYMEQYVKNLMHKKRKVFIDLKSNIKLD